MQLIGKAKIGRLSAKGIDYPQLRLPREYSSIAGEIANIFATELDGKQAFLVVTELRMLKDDTVLKPNEEVLKPIKQIDTESRLSALESEINELKSLLLLNENASVHNNTKEATERWARGDSNSGSPPCEGDVITN